MQKGTDVRHDSANGNVLYRTSGVAFVAGAIVTTVFNVMFPRADDPADTAAVLTVMADNEVRQKVAFLGVALGLWAVTVGVMGIHRSLQTGSAAAWARIGFYGVLVGVALFTASVGLGLATTRAAVDWVTAGSSDAGVEFAIASAVSAADDAVWSMSIITLWGGLGVLGIGMVLAGNHPKWLGGPILVLGFAGAVLVGIPFAYGGVSSPLILVFAGLGVLTSVWALVMGTWMLRMVSRMRHGTTSMRQELTRGSTSSITEG